MGCADSLHGSPPCNEIICSKSLHSMEVAPIRCMGCRGAGCATNPTRVQRNGFFCNETPCAATKRLFLQRNGLCCNETAFPAMKRLALQRNGFSCNETPCAATKRLFLQ